VQTILVGGIFGVKQHRVVTYSLLYVSAGMARHSYHLFCSLAIHRCIGAVSNTNSRGVNRHTVLVVLQYELRSTQSISVSARELFCPRKSFCLKSELRYWCLFKNNCTSSELGRCLIQRQNLRCFCFRF